METLTRWLLENPGLSVSISAKPDTDAYGVPLFEVTMDDLRPDMDVYGPLRFEVSMDDPRSVEVSRSKKFTTHLDVLYTDFGPNFRGTLDRMKKHIELWEGRLR